jgi:hypothetical protein
MSTGYYEEQRAKGLIPPEYEGKTWEQRTNEGKIMSPFPPATMGVPAEDVPEFRDFQNWQSRDRKEKHPGWYCQGCGIRYAVAICPSCKSGRTVLKDGYRLQVECRHVCLDCKADFMGLLLCGPCIGERQADGRLAPSQHAPARGTSRLHPMRRTAAANGGAR